MRFTNAGPHLPLKDPQFFFHWNGPLACHRGPLAVHVDHFGTTVLEHFVKNSTHFVIQPPYSLYLAPSDLCVFTKPKRLLRGHRFDSIEEIKVESKNYNGKRLFWLFPELKKTLP